MTAKKRILIVDDEPGIGTVLRIQFSLSGYEVSTTTSGAEAIELIRAQEPDIVLLDAMMPEISGADVLVKVRTFSHVPVIVFTGHADLGKYALKLGANDYITKPFDHELLLEKVAAVLNAGNPVKNTSPKKKKA
ncbi:MAG: response regulator [Dehalococcoidales bacterium]